jgi:hypothetical protein
VHFDYSIAAVFDAGTPIVPEGMLVAPGDYEVVLTVDGKQSHAPLKVVADPRVALDAAEMHAAQEFAQEINQALDRDYVGYGQLHAVDAQVEKIEKDKPVQSLLAATAGFTDASKALRAGEGETSENLGAIAEALSGLATDIEGSDRAPTQPQRELFAATTARLDRGIAQWDRVQASQLMQLSKQLEAAGLKPIQVPAADQIRLGDAPPSKDLP